MNDLKIMRVQSTVSIEIDELTSYLDDNIDFSDQDSLQSAAPIFGRLFNNKLLIRDFLISGLEHGISGFQPTNEYTPPSIILHSSDKYLIRANLWRSTKEYSEFRRA